MIANNWNIIYFLNADGWVDNRVEIGFENAWYCNKGWYNDINK